MGRGPCTSAKEFEFVRLLEGVADVTKIDPNGETADRLAAIFGSFEYGEYVLPAFSAAKNGMPGGLRVLAKLAGKLAPDVLLAKTDTFMQTPVHFAAIYGSDTCLRAFYELCGESAFYVHAPDRITPVHSAATHGKVDCLRVFKALCSHPRALSTPDEIGMTPVHCAARKGHLSFLSELLQGHLNVGMLFTATAVTATARAYLRPLDLNASYRWRLLAMRYKDKFEHEVLKKESVVLPHLALPAPLDELPQPHFKNESFRHLPHDLQVVIRVMQNLWDVDYYGDTPAHHAAKGGHARVLDLLRKAGAQSTLVARSYNANLDIGDGRTPAHYAARNGHPGCLIALHRLVADYDLSNGASSSNLVRRSSGDNISRSVDLFGVKANNGETPALDAARAGRNECLKVICGLGARRTLYERDKWEFTVAHMAVRGVHSSTLHVINELIGTQILMGSDKDGMTPAHYAARHGRDECLRVLHELLGTESLCAIDKAGMTPAHYAALYGHHGCLGLLQQFGADKSLRAKCNKGNAPVHLAAMGGHDKCLRILESYLKMRTCDGRTAAHVAAACNEPVSLRLMYKELGFPYGLGDYATRDFKQRTPAHYAAMRGSEECLRVLYQVDENLSAEDEDGSTPAHEAAKNGKEGCLRALGGELHAVHTLSALDNQANTPAHYAAAKGWPQCLRAMHELNIESVFLIGDAYDCLPAHYAAEQGHYACLRALCVQCVKSNLTAPDRYGQTPAHYAAKMDSRPCLEQLCQLVGYETFSAVDNKGRTCSHYAAENGHEACIRLLSKVSDLTVADREGETPIHLAARNRQLSMVDVLRGLGVDINIRNSLTGLTPVHYLARAGDEESLHRLVESGSLDLATKSAWLRSLLQTKFGDRSKLLLKDQPRDKVLNGLLNALFPGEEDYSWKSALPATPIDVTFINEVSYGDALRREWFGLVLNELVECGVFVNTNGTLHPNPEAGSREQQLYFTVSGWLAGLALLHGETLNHRWSIGFLKAAFGYKTTFDDIRSVDPELHQNLAAMRKMSVEELDQMCQFFVAEDRAWTRKRGSSSKRPREVALIEGGADVQVTHQTLENFLLHYAKHVVDDDELLCGYGPDQIQAFTRGLNVFVSTKTAKIVRGYCDVLDIQMTLSGFSQINSEQVDQWRQSTVYVPEGFANARQVQWLWEIIRDDTWSEKRSKLLRFCTGSERVPAGGFDRLMGYDDGSSDQPLQRFTVSLALTLTSDHLPTASSCFNKLNLPMYRTKEELLTKLELALQETRGFDLSG